MSEPLDWLSPKKFADFMGVDKTAVLYAIESGRIAEAVKRMPNGYRQIHAERGKELWKKNTKPNNMSILNRDGADSDNDDGGDSLHVAKRRREFALAEIAEIELAFKKGELVKIDDVRKTGFEAARITRDALLNIPNRISDELVSLTTRDEVYALLTKEIFEALSSLERLHNVGNNEPVS